MNNSIDFNDYVAAWLEEKEISNDLSNVEKGQRFTSAFLEEHFSLEETDIDDCLFYSDGAKDGGIDAAYLKTVEKTEENDQEYKIWYLVQSKYGTQTVDWGVEVSKIINTLTGLNQNISSKTKDVLARIQNFRNTIGENDKIIILLVSEDQIDENSYHSIKHFEQIGKKEIGNYFEIESASLRLLFENNQHSAQPEIKAIISAKIAGDKDNKHKDNNLLAGYIKLPDLYDFLKDYSNRTNNLFKIFDKNIRGFLGFKAKTNKGIKDTIENKPENFGFYNNGITIIVKDYKYMEGKGTFILTNPSIVNGCQTTTAIWDLLNSKATSAGSGKNDWREKYNKATVLLKIARVTDDEELIENITRYTNSQNAVKEKDFVALHGDFLVFKEQLAKHNIFLELQKGSWAAQLASQQKAMPNKEKTIIFFPKNNFANIFDLIKVYGAGWYKLAAAAINNNQDFSPKGTHFNTILDAKEGFNVQDLLAAFYLLQEAIFYRKNLRSTKFIFYYVVIDIIRYFLGRQNIPNNHQNISKAVIILAKSQPSILRIIGKTVVDSLTDYAENANDENSFLKEPSAVGLSNNFNRYIKNQNLLKEDHSPKLLNKITLIKMLLNSINGEAIKQELQPNLFESNSTNVVLQYAKSVKELNKLVADKGNDISWADICQHLSISINKTDTAHNTLRKWVKKNKPNWPQVP